MLLIDPKLFALAESNDINDIRQALQSAVELEHSTMPPYLYAMYSLRNSTSAINQSIARIIRQIVREEVLHMLLAGNILKALGAGPVINTPSFVPSYPTNLPGTVAGDLVVPLKSFSIELAETVFMRIEEPEHPLNFTTRTLAAAVAPPKTIGEFYGRIKKIFQEDGDDLIQDTKGEMQPTTAFFNANQTITTAQQAIDAIELIVEQGEGTEANPHFPDDDTNPDNDKLAHYYRFAELVKGKIKKNPDATADTPPQERYFYDAGDKIPFDAAQVLQFPDNPRAANYPMGGNARQASDNFNRLYTQVLGLLHDAFNGNPSKLDEAVFLMGNAMVSSAKALTQIELGDGKRAAPTFEYLK